MLRPVWLWTRRLISGYVACISKHSVLMFIPYFQSLGCTLFALAYLHSPFEGLQTTQQGGSIAMAVMNAQYKHPQSAYSQGFKNLIDATLKVNPVDRPDIHQLIEMTQRVLHSLS
jgi:serine/threonine kinase 16